MDWAYVLVIILAIFLAAFLILGIILVVLLIRVTMQIKSVTESAKRTSDAVEGFVTGARRMRDVKLLLNTVMEQATKFKKRKDK
ncbi:MAG: hypothetical protein H6797_02455 [Candidatus Nomurabacteria bacterium]|nr:MAG: hypothetical protein H6797_02455 [Candidatus Nomurabacteria bacterium]